MKINRITYLTCCTGLTVSLQAASLTWDDGGTTSDWTDAANWSGDTLPAAGDDVSIGVGQTANYNDPAQNFVGSLTLNIDGTLNLTSTTRANGATFNVSSTGSITGSGFFDLNNGTFNFSDGAAVSVTNWEVKGTNNFNFSLSSAGFTTITPVNYRRNSNNATTVTYNVDMANYLGGSDILDLMDFGSDTTGLTDELLQGDTTASNISYAYNITNVPTGLTASLQWNDSTDAVQLVIIPEPTTAALALVGGLTLLRRRRTT